MSAASAARGDRLGTVSRRNFLRIGGGVTAALGALAATGATVHGAGPARLVAAVDAAQARPEASTMELIGFDDLQARSAYQVLVHHHTTAGSDRWILSVGLSSIGSFTSSFTGTYGLSPSA